MTKPAPAPTPKRGVKAPLPRGRWGDLARRFRRNRAAMAALVIFGALVAMVALGPLVWRIDPSYVDIRARNASFSLAHPLGTDQLGRDLLARLMAGGRISLGVGLTAMAISIGIGSLVGMLAGYFRKLDAPLMRLTELFLALPLLPLLLLMVALFRESLGLRFGAAGGSFLLIVGAIGATSWMQAARVVRAEVLAVKERDFILAATSIGTRPARMLTRHVLPNVLSPILVSATLGMASAIITESSLSFLGLGFPPDFPTWGRLLFDAIDQMVSYPWRVLLPGLMISLTVLCVNYIGEGMRDALDPRAKG